MMKHISVIALSIVIAATSSFACGGKKMGADKASASRATYTSGSACQTYKGCPSKANTNTANQAVKRVDAKDLTVANLINDSKIGVRVWDAVSGSVVTVNEETPFQDQDGKRYYFAADKYKVQFIGNPARYIVEDNIEPGKS